MNKIIRHTKQCQYVDTLINALATVLLVIFMSLSPPSEEHSEFS